MKKNPFLLLVDDERQFSSLAKEYLEMKGCRVALKHSAAEGLASFQQETPDLCIFDVKMPMKDGFTLAQEIRDLNPIVPIIFLTGQQERSQRIKGLSLGADDYVTKPFSMEELYLRIRNILKRVGLQAQEFQEKQQFQVGKFEFDATSRELTFVEKTTKLSAIESKLLQMFCEHENGVIERQQALKRIWGDDDYLRGRSLNVYVSKLRQYLKKDQNIEILNVHGIGYKMIIK